MSSVHRVIGVARPLGDVVFVHGLNGDPYTTWASSPKDLEGWFSWLPDERQDLNVWTLEYDASPSQWFGHAMPLADRAVNVLAELDAWGIGQRPICFIAHSLGGLLVKEVLRTSSATALTQHRPRETQAVHKNWRRLFRSALVQDFDPLFDRLTR